MLEKSSKKHQRLVFLFTIFITSIIIFLLWPSRFAKHYDYIKPNEIYDNLMFETTRNISLERLNSCEYEDIIKTNEFMYTEIYRTELFNSQEIHYGGEYYSDECRPKFSSAIIIPYRKREQQLHAFLIYMHNYLRKQNVHYRIFLIEQYDQKKFNRAKLFNIGSIIAAQYEYPCLILHDVDLMPLNLGHIYACSQQPRHMCSSLDEFRYNLPYIGLFGGAVAIRTEQYRFINGMSNMYEGWGGEDDDFYDRLISRNINICRFAPDYSKYTMLRHTKVTPSSNRMDILNSGPQRYHSDGLISLKYKLIDIKMHSLFTHVLIET